MRVVCPFDANGPSPPTGARIESLRSPGRARNRMLTSKYYVKRKGAVKQRRFVFTLTPRIKYGAGSSTLPSGADRGRYSQTVLPAKAGIQGWGVLRQAQDERFTGLPTPVSPSGVGIRAFHPHPQMRGGYAVESDRDRIHVQAVLLLLESQIDESLHLPHPWDLSNAVSEEFAELDR